MSISDKHPLNKWCSYTTRYLPHLNKKNIYISLYKNSFINVYSTFIHKFKKKKLETTQMSVNRSFSSVQLLICVHSLQPHGLQHTRPPCPLPTPGVYSNTCPLSWWCHPAFSSSVIPFSSYLQSLPASEFFQMSQLFISGDQSIAVSASTLVLPMNIQDWFPLGWARWICLKSRGLSRAFSNTTVRKHQFFGAQLSL